MKLLTKSAMSIAIVAAMAATSAQANQFQQFLDDSSLDLNLRNYYKTKNIKTENSESQKDKGWAQAVNLSFSSGFFADIIGFDLSSHYTFKAKDSIGKDNVSDSGLFLVNTDKNGKRHGHSYGKVLGAAKLNLMGNGIAKYGRMVLDTPLLNDTIDDSSLPSTTEAFYIDYSLHGLTVFGAIATKSSAATETGYEYYEVNGKKKAVNTIGASYEWQGLNLSGAYAKQSNAIKATYLDGSYRFDLAQDLALTLGGQYGRNKAIGFVKRDEFSTGQGTKIDWFGAKAEVNYQNITAMIALTDIDGGKNSGWTDAAVGWSGQPDGSDDGTEFMGYNSVMISDFHAANETAVQFRVGYDFADMIPGLSAYALYVDGTIENFNAGQKDTTTSEYNVGIQYALPMLDGLQVSLAHGEYEKDPHGDSNTITEKETRIIVTYDLAVF